MRWRVVERSPRGLGVSRGQSSIIPDCTKSIVGKLRTRKEDCGQIVWTIGSMILSESRYIEVRWASLEGLSALGFDICSDDMMPKFMAVFDRVRPDEVRCALVAPTEHYHGNSWDRFLDEKLLSRHQGLPLPAVIDGASPKLEKLIRDATHPDALLRTDSAAGDSGLPYLTDEDIDDLDDTPDADAEETQEIVASRRRRPVLLQRSKRNKLGPQIRFPCTSCNTSV